MTTEVLAARETFPRAAIAVSEGMVTVRAERDVGRLLALLPGASWDGRQWALPASPTTAAGVVQVVTGLRCQVIFPDSASQREFLRLTLEQEEVRAAGVEREADSEPAPLPFDPGLPAPYRHQLRAYHFCLRMRSSLLEMGMGTGKTRTALLVARGRECRTVLVTCPRSVVGHWVEEIGRYWPGSGFVLGLDSGSVAKKASRASDVLGTADAWGASAIVIVNYDSVWRDPLATLFARRPWDLVIADECHRIKAPGSRVSMFFRRLSRVARSRLGLSGTPLSESPLDAYGQFRFLDPGIFGISFAHFRQRYAVLGGVNDRQVVAYRHMEEFRARYRSITFAASSDLLDLPPEVDVDRAFDLPPVARRLYDDLRREFVAELVAGTVVASNVLARLTRLRQITSGFAGGVVDPETGEVIGETVPVHDARASLLQEVIEELPAGEAVVVFCLFRQDLAAVHRAAERAGRRSMELSGERNELDAWADGGAEVIAVQMAAGGEGVDKLKRASVGIYYSIGFSRTKYEQSRARLRRPGQRGERVLYVHLKARGTVDELTYRAIARKAEVVGAVLRGEEVL